MTNPLPSELSTHQCVPCEGGVEPLTREEFSIYLEQLPEWKVIEDKVIEREFTLKNFAAAITFINKVAEIAESEGHHPDLQLHSYKKVKVILSTHAINGLSVNDFVMAVKIDALHD
ncbi:MAG: 4a-hydroxytetrahydrobiopterin dehydratase [bacterium]|nr:4a-hydroxytetrahydrobiopterin dehydratase [bacterium]